MPDQAKQRRIPLDTCVRAFLELVMMPPERTPKRQRDQRDNDMILHGFNRAQEKLREILELNGTPAAAALADVRAEGQQQPIMVGDQRMWML